MNINSIDQEAVTKTAKVALITALTLFLLQKCGKYSIILIVVAILTFMQLSYLPKTKKEIENEEDEIEDGEDGEDETKEIVEETKEIVEEFLEQSTDDTIYNNIGMPSSYGRSFYAVPGSPGRTAKLSFQGARFAGPVGLALPGGKASLNTSFLTNEYISKPEPLDVPGSLNTTKEKLVQTRNGLLYGPQNPKTLIPPPIAPPLGDLEFWKSNEWVTHSHINTRNVQYSDEYIGGECSVVNYLTSRPDCRNNIMDGTECTFAAKRYGHQAQASVPTESFARALDETPLNKQQMEMLNNSNPLIENFVSELQPGIYSEPLNQPIYANAGLLPDFPLPVTTLRSENIEGENIQIYKEEIEKEGGEPYKNEPYRTLDRAYVYPEKLVKERLPIRYGDWSKRSVRTGNEIQTEMIKDLSGSEEMSRYVNSRNKLDMYDVTVGAPLFEINKSAVQNYLNVTNRFRADLQETLMRKRNAEEWIRKQYPIDVNHRRMQGGMQ